MRFNASGTPTLFFVSDKVLAFLRKQKIIFAPQENLSLKILNFGLEIAKSQRFENIS